MNKMYSCPSILSVASETRTQTRGMAHVQMDGQPVSAIFLFFFIPEFYRNTSASLSNAGFRPELRVYIKLT